MNLPRRHCRTLLKVSETCPLCFRCSPEARLHRGGRRDGGTKSLSQLRQPLADLLSFMCFYNYLLLIPFLGNCSESLGVRRCSILINYDNDHHQHLGCKRGVYLLISVTTAANSSSYSPAAMPSRHSTPVSFGPEEEKDQGVEIYSIGTPPAVLPPSTSEIHVAGKTLRSRLAPPPPKRFPS